MLRIDADMKRLMLWIAKGKKLTTDKISCMRWQYIPSCFCLQQFKHLLNQKMFTHFRVAPDETI